MRKSPKTNNNNNNNNNNNKIIYIVKEKFWQKKKKKPKKKKKNKDVKIPDLRSGSKNVWLPELIKKVQYELNIMVKMARFQIIQNVQNRNLL